MFDDTFGESEVTKSGLSYTNFKGQSSGASGALITKCGAKSLLGGAYLSSENSIISMSFTGL